MRPARPRPPVGPIRDAKALSTICSMLTLISPFGPVVACTCACALFVMFTIGAAPRPAGATGLRPTNRLRGSHDQGHHRNTRDCQPHGLRWPIMPRLAGHLHHSVSVSVRRNGSVSAFAAVMVAPKLESRSSWGSRSFKGLRGGGSRNADPVPDAGPLLHPRIPGA